MRRERIELKRIFPEMKRGRYITHALDSYPAKMIPQMARFLIDKVSSAGETVLDPFCGSGAVLVESAVSGRNAIGVDFNPYAVLLATAKATLYDNGILQRQQIGRAFCR